MQAWEDFAAFMATGANIQNRRGREVGFVLSPADTHALFEDLRERFAAGDRHALWRGIAFASQYNVPLPYWLADEVLSVDTTLRTTTASAHALLGLDAVLPLSASRARLARRKLRLSVELWFEVRRQKRARPGLSDSQAVQRARVVMDFPYRQREAFAMYREQDAKQRRHEALHTGVKRLHR